MSYGRVLFYHGWVTFSPTGLRCAVSEHPEISAEEKAARRQAVEYAQASVALEGLKQTDEAIAYAQRFIDGEIDLDEYLATTYDELNGG